MNIKKVMRMGLWPLAMLYYMITSIRNYLFDKAILRSFSFEIPLIGVGNLTVGGTGKTPITMAITEMLLSMKRSPAILSRGYKRKTKGFVEATATTTVEEIGDEPFMMYHRFNQTVQLAVCEQRWLGITHLLFDNDKSDVIVMDDVFQHRSVEVPFLVLLCDYNRPFFEDHHLPFGLLRESRYQAARANVILVTKCPSHILDQEKAIFNQNIQKYTGNKPIYWIHFRQQLLKQVLGNPTPLNIQSRAICISGLADARGFVEQMKQEVHIIHHFDFSDHYTYKIRDMEMLIKYSEKNNIQIWITTEKDWVKWHQWKKIIPYPVFISTLEMVWIDDQTQFINQIEAYLQDAQ